MSLKSFLTKIIPGKKEPDTPPPAPAHQNDDDIIQHEISFDQLQR